MKIAERGSQSSDKGTAQMEPEETPPSRVVASFTEDSLSVT